jgi:hypothetical protein
LASRIGLGNRISKTIVGTPDSPGANFALSVCVVIQAGLFLQTTRLFVCGVLVGLRSVRRKRGNRPCQPVTSRQAPIKYSRSVYLPLRRISFLDVWLSVAWVLLPPPQASTICGTRNGAAETRRLPVRTGNQPLSTDWPGRFVCRSGKPPSLDRWLPAARVFITGTFATRGLRNSADRRIPVWSIISALHL